MLCHPNGQTKPYTAAGINITQLTKMTELTSMSAHPYDRKPEFIFAPGLLGDWKKEVASFTVGENGSTWVAQLLFPAAEPVEGSTCLLVED